MSIFSLPLVIHAALAATPVTMTSPPVAPGSPLSGGELAHHFVGSHRVATSQHFRMVHTGDADAGEALVDMLEEGRARFLHLFSAAGFALYDVGQPLVWALFDTHAEFDRMSFETERRDLSWLDAYYSPQTNCVTLVRLQTEEMVADSDGTVVATSARPLACTTPVSGTDVARVLHELAHQLAFNSGVMERGVVYPLWAAEGLADYFAGFLSPCAQRRSRFWAGGLTAAKGDGRGSSLTLRELVGLTDLPGDDSTVANAIYDEAESLFGFLLETRRDALLAFLAAAALSRSGEATRSEREGKFVSAFGDIDLLEAAWVDSTTSLAF